MTLTPNKNLTALAPAGTRALFFDVVDSTNTIAASYAATGDRGPLWLVSGAQTAGRGRRARVWTSETGNFYASYLFQPVLRPADMGGLPFAVCLAVRDAVIKAGISADTVKCKWPNDVMIDGKKVCGILIESAASTSSMMDYVIVGIGVNLAHYPSDAQISATSLTAQGVTCNIESFTGPLSAALDHWLTRFQSEGTAPIIQEWRQYAWGMGQERVIRTANDSFSATLLSLMDDGALRVRLGNGTEKSIYVGDIFPPTQPE